MNRYATAVMLAALASAGSPSMAACDRAEAVTLLESAPAAVARYARLPETCLKAHVMGCAAASEQTLLPTMDALTCSVAYEALLKRVFRGDFEALLAWWRSERAGDTQTPSASAE